MGAVFRVQCTFPYMEGVAMPNEKSNKIWKKIRKKLGDGAYYCWW